MENNPSSKAVVKAPLKQIRPSPRNPRRIITQAMINARAASMDESGQADPIKVRPLTPEEKAKEPNPEVI